MMPEGAFFRRDMQKVVAAGWGSFSASMHPALIVGVPEASLVVSLLALFLLRWPSQPPSPQPPSSSTFPGSWVYRRPHLHAKTRELPHQTSLYGAHAYPYYPEGSGGLPVFCQYSYANVPLPYRSGRAKTVAVHHSPFSASSMIGILRTPGNTSYMVKYNSCE